MKGRNGGTLNPFKKGKSGNPTGRPKKFVSLLKEMGYKKSEIADTMLAILAMDIDELKDVYQNQNTTILEKLVASAMKKAIEKGDLNSLEIILNRVHGAPKQEIENTILSQKPILSINPIVLDNKDDNLK